MGIGYMLLICVLISVAGEGIAALAAGAGCVVCVAGIVWYIYMACSEAMRGVESCDLIRQCFWMKLWLVPLYIFVFVWGVGLALVPFGVFMIPIAAALDYIVLIGSSSYGIAGLVRANREGKITFKVMAIYIILQLLFCLDFVSICTCMRRQKSWTTG